MHREFCVIKCSDSSNSVGWFPSWATWKSTDRIWTIRTFYDTELNSASIHYFNDSLFCILLHITSDGASQQLPIPVSSAKFAVCVVVSAASFPPSPRSSASSDNVLQRSPIPNPVNNNCSPRNIINIVLSSPTQQPNRNTLILIIYFILLITTPIPTTIAF